MRPRLKRIADQVVVITGASSGIGLETARLASSRGARVVLGGRSGDALARLADEIKAGGGQAAFAVGDVTVQADVEALAATAIDAFGGFDTWVNNAGISAYGSLDEVPIDDARKLFEVNFWGLVTGTRIAMAHLRVKGGAIINLGSEVAERGIPLQGFYSATKHAIKGFTEALRAEVDADGAPVAITLIKPGAIDTPYTVNAKNYMASEPQHAPPPVYAPITVARAIVRAAEHPLRDVYVGGAARMVGALTQFAPGVTDRLLARVMVPDTPSGRAPRRARDASGLDVATESLETRGNYGGEARGTSLYTEAATRPWITAASLAGSALLLRALWKAVPQRRAVLRGRKGGRHDAKGLHITLEARRGREQAVLELLSEIRGSVAREPGTLPWFALRRNRRVFEIFERFDDERGRRAHLRGDGAAVLLARSRALLRRPARITRLDVVEAKTAIG